MRYLPLLLLAPLALAQDLIPYSTDWSKAEQSIINHSRYLTGPAGKDGFVTVVKERMVTPDGKRFRIWGINVTGPQCFPDKELAPAIADDIARLGVNCVRFHHADATWGRNWFIKESNDTRALNPDSLDRLDFFVNELKKRGIYSNLNLNVSRHFKEGDGVRDYKLLGYAKGATYYNARLIELQHEFARQVLTHKNPYTGNEYRHEPAVAAIELVNENSLVEAWINWRLVGKDDPAASTWSPLPVSYTEELTDQYNAWLAKNVSADELAAIRKECGSEKVVRLTPSQFAKASKLRFQSEAKFYIQLENAFFGGFRKLLKEELGAKPIVIGSADHSDGTPGFAHILANNLLDVIDGHGYWEHPRLGKEVWIKNTPMVNDPLDSTYAQFARTPLAGRPYTISETNHPFPHEYACEGFPILTAYSLFADWDGIYWFEYGRGRVDRKADGRIGGSFGFSDDPMKMTTLAALAPMWWRGDVATAKQTVVRSYTADHVVESLRMDRNKQRPFFDPAFPRSTPLQHNTRWQLVDKPVAPSYPPAAELSQIRSDTGELSWQGADEKKGLVRIDTARTCALIGFVSADPQFATRHLAAAPGNRFAALMLTSLDDQPIEKSARLLLLTTAKCTNTDLKWKEDHQTIANWGKGPTLIEPVSGQVQLKNLRAKGVKLTPLTAEGRPTDKSLSASAAGNDWNITLAPTATTWYLVEVSP